MLKKIALLLYYFIGFYLPGPPFPLSKTGHAVRRKLTRVIFSKSGNRTIIGRRVNFGDGNSITIGDNSNIGRGSWVANDTIFGENVMTGPDIVILSYNHSTLNNGVPYNQQGYTERKKVVIGNNVWIGTRVTILPGVTIGDNCIIGAGAVVAKSIPNDSVAVGNPCRVIRTF